MEGLIFAFIGERITRDIIIDMTNDQTNFIVTKKEVETDKKIVNELKKKYFDITYIQNEIFDFTGTLDVLRTNTCNFYPSIILLTLKGLSKDGDYVENCKKEYKKIFDKINYDIYKNKYNIKNLALLPYLNLINNLDPKKINIQPYLNNKRYSIEDDDKHIMNNLYDENSIIIRGMIVGLKFYKNKMNMIKEIIKNVEITHHDTNAYLGAICAGLIVNYILNDIPIIKWVNEIENDLLNEEVNKVIKDIGVYKNEEIQKFILDKEEIITFFKNTELNMNNIYSTKIFEYFFNVNLNSLTMEYGLKASDSIVLVYCILKYNYYYPYYNNLVRITLSQYTDIVPILLICSFYYGLKNKFNNFWIERYKKEEWFINLVKYGEKAGIKFLE